MHNHNTFGIRKLLSDKKIDEGMRELLVTLPDLNGDGALQRAYDLSEGLKAQEAVRRLMEVRDLLQVYGVQDAVSFDFGMLSAYMYYTGIIFRGYTYGTGEAVVKGGRYDGLLSHFGKDTPSVGFVIVVSQLMNALSRQKIDILPEHERYLILYAENCRKEALKKAVTYRAQGKYTELCSLSCLRSGEDSAHLPERLREEGGYASVIVVE
jgi:ATP phosphoribosyltransferase regulatory subunit